MLRLVTMSSSEAKMRLQKVAFISPYSILFNLRHHSSPTRITNTRKILPTPFTVASMTPPTLSSGREKYGSHFKYKMILENFCFSRNNSDDGSTQLNHVAISTQLLNQASVAQSEISLILNGDYHQDSDNIPYQSRRVFLRSLFITTVSWLSIFFIVPGNSAQAFENRIAPFDKYPKQPGSVSAKTLGPRGQEGVFSECGAAPNCFRTQTTNIDPLDQYSEIPDPLHSLRAWRYPGDDRELAKNQLLDVIKSYPPGQSGIDGGGFKIIYDGHTQPDPNKDKIKGSASYRDGYFYVQFESFKHGYIDDLQFFVGDNGLVHLRSASRLGYLDFRVNAKRINWFAAQLKSKYNWTTYSITERSHPDYYQVNPE